MANETASLPVNVVICTYGRCDLMRRTLESLAGVNRPGGFEQVWVIENGSDDGTRGVCEQMRGRLPLKYVNLPQKGKSRALQYALEAIGRGLVIFTDDDVRLAPESLVAYVKAAGHHGPGCFYGGPVYIDYERQPPGWLLAHLPPSVTGWQLDDPDTPITKATFLGANYGGFVEMILKAGGYDADLGIGSQGNPVGEEFEIQDRLLAAGCRGVYIPDAKVWHYVPKVRSSPKWTMRRHERIWFTSALTGQNQEQYQGTRLFGVPRWMWKRLAGLWIKALAANLIVDAQKRFNIQKQYYQWKGTVRGVRLRWQRMQEGKL